MHTNLEQHCREAIFAVPQQDWQLLLASKHWILHTDDLQQSCSLSISSPYINYVLWYLQEPLFLSNLNVIALA